MRKDPVIAEVTGKILIVRRGTALIDLVPRGGMWKATIVIDEDGRVLKSRYTKASETSYA